MKKIVVVGFDHVIKKLKYFYNFGKYSKNINTFYLSSDKGEITKNNDENDIKYLPSNKILKFLEMFKVIKNIRPDHIEVYFDRLDDMLYIYLISKILKIPIISVCRGSDLYEWKSHKKVRKILMKSIFKLSKFIFIKELHMRASLERLGIPNEKIVEIHNAISIDEFYIKFNKFSKNIIFINSFRRMRNVKLLVESFLEFNLKVQNKFKLILIGSTLNNPSYSPASKEYELEIRNLIEEKDINNSIEILPFSLNPWEKINDALLFVLPADVVWLNNALLEAMAKGIVPVISDVEGSEKIVKDNETGFLTKIDKISLIEVFFKATQDIEKLEIISKNCIEYTRKNFSVDRVYETIYNTYKKVWMK